MIDLRRLRLADAGTDPGDPYGPCADVDVLRNRGSAALAAMVTARDGIAAMAMADHGQAVRGLSSVASVQRDLPRIVRNDDPAPPPNPLPAGFGPIGVSAKR